MWLSAQEIFDKVDKMEAGWSQKSICLTGGEPLMIENKEFMINELIPLFVSNHYDVGLETNGAVDYTDYKQVFGDSKIINAHGDTEGVTIISDYKLPGSRMTHLMLKSNFKLYSETDLIKMVISDDEEDWKELDKVVNSETKASIYLSPCFGEVTMRRIPEYIMKHNDKHIRAQIQVHKIFWDPTKKDI